MEVKSAGDFPDGGLKQMSSCDTLARVNDGILKCGRVWMGGGLSVSKPLEQSLSNGTFPAGFGAIDNTVATWCYVWLGEGQQQTEEE